jgi:hypothetical protein
LEIAPLVAVERSIARKGESIQHWKASRQRLRHFFQGLLDSCFRLGEASLVTAALRLAALDEHGENNDPR